MPRSAILSGAVLLAGMLLSGGAAPAAPADAPAKPQIELYMSPNATFVAYKPKDWAAKEAADGAMRTIAVTDPTGQLTVRAVHGISPAGNNPEAVAGLYLAMLVKQHADATLVKAWSKKTHFALICSYTTEARAKREQHVWTNVINGNFIVTVCDTPEGQFEQNKEMLLSIVGNIRPINGALPWRPGLVEQKLADGSAAFALPEKWEVKDMGKGTFIAGDKAADQAFMSLSAQLLTPKLGLNPQGVPVAPYMAPSQAMRMLAIRAGLVDDMKLVTVNEHRDIPRPAQGQITLEDWEWTATKGQKHSHGFSFGFTTLSGTGTVWTLWHMTASSPETSFKDFVPTAAAVMESYRLDDKFVTAYVREGMKRVQEMERETVAKYQRTAEEIRQINTAIYENKSRSQDYLSYAWSGCIRGESDWISQVEGGSVYRSDSWGATNLETGEYYNGKHWDYTHFQGQNPKYGELMQEVNNRELYEKYVKKMPG